MRKFIKKTALLAAFTFMTLLCICIYYQVLTKPDKLAGEIFYVIDKAGHNSGHQIVYLGDSVCNQLWPQTQDGENVSYLGCNQAITAAGTYLLLREYLEHNPQTKEAYYIVHPDSLGNDLYLNYTYQYFVIPFVNDSSMNLLAEETIKMLYQKFGELFVRSSFVKKILTDNDMLMKLYLSSVQKQTEKKYIHRLSRTSIIYLAKIRELCKEHNVRFYVRPIPMSDMEKNRGWNEFEQDIRRYGFEDMFGDYVQKIHYYPEDWFTDTVHFKPEILKQSRDVIVDAIMK